MGFEIRRGRRTGGESNRLIPIHQRLALVLQAGDVISSIEGATRGASMERIFDRFLNGDRNIELTISRDQSSMRINLPIEEADVDIPFDATARVPMQSLPKPIFECDLPVVTQDLEDRLDNAVVSIASELEGQGQSILDLPLEAASSCPRTHVLVEHLRSSPRPISHRPSSVRGSRSPAARRGIRSLPVALAIATQRRLPIESLTSAAQPKKPRELFDLPRPDAWEW